ncbi:MAG: TetR/AcrR family transcriptional regulator [Paracoccaceae bacterium]
MSTDPHEPGSPPDRIVKAARRLYFSQPVATVSTDLLAREASVSKTTLYKYFPDTDDVLRAVVEGEAARFEAGVPTTVDGPDALCDALVQYGARLLGFLNEPEILQFGRLMHEEARTHPDVARTFYDAAYGRTHARLAALIGQGLTAGYLRSSLTSAELAEQLIGMWEGPAYVRAQLALTDRPFEDPEDWAAKCVATLFGKTTELDQEKGKGVLATSSPK